jgi:hypothetical protein
MAGILLITIIAVEIGGISLFINLTRRIPGYLDNPMRRGLFTAGHAHAGVLVLLALISLPYIDNADLSDSVKQLVRWGMVAPPILMPLGFFLSVASPRATEPNKLVWLAPFGGAVLAVTVVVLGVGLLGAG